MQACATLPLPAALAPRPSRAGVTRRSGGSLVVCQAQPEVKRGALGVELGERALATQPGDP